jgi:ribosome biogenesis GTPase A
MTKARRELAALMPSQDLVIEVLDARLPAASRNPVVGELAAGKPRIQILTKSDLADPAATRAWIEHLAGVPATAAFAATLERAGEIRKQIVLLAGRLGVRHTRDRPLRALITGVPNVGKSSLINVLMERLVAKTGDKPAVTKQQQRVVLPSGMIVTDSPGLMWPKIEDETGALRLALAGSIPDTAIDYATIGRFGARLFLETYPALVVARYKLPHTPATAEALLTEIGRRRGALGPGGIVDIHKAAEVLVREFRQGILGRISLEIPPPSTAATA